MSQYKILDKNSTKNKIILLRVDFNVPINNKKIQDITRINKMREIIPVSYTHLTLPTIYSV